MKIRNDFVSNSSSCSFIITGQMASDAIKFFSKTFADVDVPELDISVFFVVKNKFYNDVAIAFNEQQKNVYDCDPDELCWNYFRISLPELAGSDRLMSVIDKIEELHFDCDDYDTYAVLNLSRLYYFFERNGFAPDRTASETEFTSDCESEFVKVLNNTNNIKQHNK